MLLTPSVDGEMNSMRTSSVRLSSVRPSSTLFKHLRLQNHWASQSQISYGASLGCSNGPVHMTKTVAMPIYGKNLKQSSSLELGMQHRVLEYYQIYSNDDPGLTLTYFTARSNLVPDAFVWGKR